MTVLQTKVMTALQELGGSATVVEVARHLDIPNSSAANALQNLRGHGLVVDNSTSKRILDGQGRLVAIVRTDPKGPKIWTVA